MGDVRLRMVILGLVLGVVVAVIFASQGCGPSHHKRHGAALTPSRATAALYARRA